MVTFTFTLCAVVFPQPVAVLMPQHVLGLSKSEKTLKKLDSQQKAKS